MTSGKSKIILGLLAMLGLPCTALANAGTPLMWGAFGHLALGNIFIGILEGNILRWRNSGKGYQTVTLMILANYFSAFCGIFIIGGLDALWACHWTLLNLKTNFFLMVVLLWLATVLLEWPFVWFAMGKELRRWGKALKISFILQSVSYVLLVGWYMLCGNHSLLTCKIVSPEEIGIPDNVCIYYIANDDFIYKTHIGKDSPVKIAQLPRKLRDDEISDGYEAFLIFLADEDEPAKANLMERTYTRRAFGRSDLIPVISHFEDTDRVLLTPFGKDQNLKYGDCNPYIGRPFGNAIASNYRFYYDNIFAEFGIILMKKREKDSPPRNIYPKEPDAYGFSWQDWLEDRTLFALGSPIAVWGIRNIIQFENDTILFEFKNHQICLFDYRTRRIALLTKGYGATTAIEENPTKAYE